MKKLGMMKTILMMGCALALLFAAVPQPVMAANSQMNLTVGTTNDAKAGDTVTVRLVGSNNPGLSTFAGAILTAVYKAAVKVSNGTAQTDNTTR